MLEMIICECMGPDTKSKSKMIRALGLASHSCAKVGPQVENMLSSAILNRRWPRVLSVAWSSTAAQAEEKKLPPLPVPPLDATIEKLIKTAKPHLSPSELGKTLSVAQDFAKPGGIGHELHERLVKKAQQCENWLEDWWLDYSYLGFRSPVVVHSSPGLMFPLQTFQNESERLLYAARMIVGALNYKLLIDHGKIPQDRQGSNLLDMAQYKRVFGVCRIPEMPLDKLRFPDSRNPPKHIVVAHNNHFFKLPVLTDRGMVLDEAQIMFMLKHIIENSKEPAPAVGILSSTDRDAWSKSYSHLSSLNNFENKKNLEAIETSLFLMCLDKKNPEMSSHFSKRTISALQMLHGLGSQANSGNRWFDKTIQFIVGTDGQVGLCYEHSPAEGQPIAVMMEFILKHIASSKNEYISEVTCPRPEPLPFRIDQDISSAIEDASRKIDSLVADVDMSIYSFLGYGKEFPKLHKMSPDSFIQMAMQLAFYRIHSEPGATYETANTRMFLGGRTETIRSCSVESTAFCKTMLEPCANMEQKFRALKCAVTAHREYTTDASRGLGVDRHLLGLKLIAQECGYELPALYSDPGYVRSSRFRISSSQVAASVEAVMCYGPLVTDGYACCYNPMSHQIMFAVCAMNACPETSSQSFVEALEQSLKEMETVVSSCSNTQSKL